MVDLLPFREPEPSSRRRRIPWLAITTLLVIAAAAGFGVRALWTGEDAYEIAEEYGADRLRPAAERTVAEEIAALVGDRRPLAGGGGDVCQVSSDTDTGDIFVETGPRTLTCVVGYTVVLSVLARDDADAVAETQRILGDRCPVSPTVDDPETAFDDHLAGAPCPDDLRYGLYATADAAQRDRLEEDVNTTWLTGAGESLDGDRLADQARETGADHVLVLTASRTYLDRLLR